MIPPDFAIDRALVQLNQFAGTAPAQTVLVQTLVRRLPQFAELSEAERTAMATRAETAVRDQILPAYRRQIEALRAVRARAVHEAGIWRLPQGGDMYAAALRSRTTTDLSPDQIHAMGAGADRTI